MRLLLFVLGRATRKTTKNATVLIGCATVVPFWDARLRRGVNYGIVAFVVLGTRDSDKDWTIQLLLFALVRANQQKTWL